MTWQQERELVDVAPEVCKLILRQHGWVELLPKYRAPHRDPRWMHPTRRMYLHDLENAWVLHLSSTWPAENAT